MLRGNSPPPNIPSFSFSFYLFSFTFKKKSENFGGGFEPPEPPAPLNTPLRAQYHYLIRKLKRSTVEILKLEGLLGELFLEDLLTIEITEGGSEAEG